VTAPGGNLGRAFIEVHADTAPFNQELQMMMARSVKATAPAAQKAGQGIGNNVSRGVQRAIARNARGFSTLGQRIGRDFMRNLEREVKGRHNTIVAGFALLGRSIISVFQNVGQSVSGIFGGGGGSGGGGGKRGGLLGILGSIGSSVGNVGSKGPLGPIIGGALILGIPALIGLIGTLINELGGLINVVGYLPGAFAIAAASIVPLVVGFQGFGDALGAILSRDPEKIAEALKQLTPYARSFVLEIQKALPIFTALRQVAQENLFARLVGGKYGTNQFTRTMEVLGPILRGGFAQVGASWGRFFSSFLALIREPATQAFFTNLFSTTATIFDRLGPGFVDTLRGLFSIADATLPRLEQIGLKFAGMLSDFGDWLIAQSENGNLNDFLDTFHDALKDLLELSKSGYRLFEAILQGIDVGGSQHLFDTIIEMIDSLTEFFKSETGKKGLEGMVTLAFGFLAILTGIIVAWSTIVALVQAVIDGIKEILYLLGLAEPDQKFVGRIGALGQGNGFRGLAEGDIVTSPEMVQVGEAGAEAIIPLTDTTRARQIMAEAGLDRLASGGTEVYVFVGNEEFQAYIVDVQRKQEKQMAREMRYGPRPLGTVA
jgi:hypothetical protein